MLTRDRNSLLIQELEECTRQMTVFRLIFSELLNENWEHVFFREDFLELYQFRVSTRKSWIHEAGERMQRRLQQEETQEKISRPKKKGRTGGRVQGAGNRINTEQRIHIM